ncbi:hypothetical protein [Cryptosporidium parvum Iowa II]|uniref:Uncharacterized protein n=2 Tax=Cryptosporidium parvum TaxID=5807 RepID=Q5CQP9_CRYPI|nr:hypothetical protein [Cryptosporidium parvum Iowa II]EAK87745.1 hypothetical protein cgd4_3780 [Cryptosporidium parvum Iowa II]QOY42057.1 Uncharacterized protein CPATCC_0018800 [Cryptosporidium parvum]WKS77360.1 hypothetical protein CPCDC_4g3780 [Cryptosporidium sp. 43IA8]WRK31969.1 Uncharacterized protein cpbgf_4003780 [Cryptosporidium parvum]|eukprot:QOY42057.1 hypothetical protein CPATCC_001655 [Cryptosporidium parvum]
MEVCEWIKNLEMGVLAAIEITRNSILENSSNKEFNIMNEYDKLYNKIETLCKDQKEFYEYILESSVRDESDLERIKEFQDKIKLEKITQKLENSKEYLKECIKCELQNINYIDTLSIMWKHS